MRAEDDFCNTLMPRIIQNLTNGSSTHHEEVLKALFVQQGMYMVIEMSVNSIPLSIQNLLNEFMKYRQENLE